MALTLDDTISGETSNSYVDVAYADTYFGSHYSSAKFDQWIGLTAAQKTLALINACQVIERCKFTNPYTWNYEPVMRVNLHTHNVEFHIPTQSAVRYDVYQNLQFPRNFDVASDGSTFIPEEVKMAQCEQAVYLLSADDAAITNSLQGVTSDTVRAGDVTTTQSYIRQGTLLAPMALELLTPFFIRSSRVRRA